jgi:hypothetical protein
MMWAGRIEMGWGPSHYKKEPRPSTCNSMYSSNYCLKTLFIEPLRASPRALYLALYCKCGKPNHKNDVPTASVKTLHIF